MSTIEGQGERIRLAMHALLPEIAARAEEIEQSRAVPLDLLDKIEQAGGLRMAVPALFGGAEMSLREICDVVEQVAASDGSTAWQVSIPVGMQILTARLPLASLTRFYADGPNAWSKGAYTPKAAAVPVDGGYRLSGRWPLASGGRPFKWASFGFMIREGKGIRQLPDGRPDIRVCIIPADGVKVIKTWNAVGLRGTCSDDLEVGDVFVPEAWQGSFFGESNLDSPVLRGMMPGATAPLHGAIMLGILRGALEDLAGSAQTRRPAANPALLLKDDPVFLARLGQMLSRTDALRALNSQNIDTLTAIADERRLPTPLETSALCADGTFIDHECTRIMDDIMTDAGSGAIFDDSAQQRRWRDLRCAAQHQAANLGNYGQYGAAFAAATAPDRARAPVSPALAS